MAKGTIKAAQTVKPKVPEAEVEEYAHPAVGGHHVTEGYNPSWGTWDRREFGNEKFRPDTWELDRLEIKRPTDSDHDYDKD